jgi:hypothetical protein
MFKLFGGKVTLHVKADSPLDEVFLLDSGLQLVAKDLGGLTAENLDPGVYKIKFKSGETVQEKSLVLNEATVLVTGDAVRFATPIPLDGTKPVAGPEGGRPARRKRTLRSARGAEHAEAVPASMPIASEPPYVWNGTGAGLYFYLVAKDAASARRIMSTAQLVDEHGGALSAVAEGPAFSQSFDCEPGNYILRVDAGEAGLVDMCLPVSPGWRLCVFMPVREVGRESRVEVPDVLNAGIVYIRLHEAWNSADQSLRWTEQARLALLAGRTVAPRKQLEELLVQDWHQPMYLLLGAHMLLREPDVDRSLLTRLIAQLTMLLPHHQDVELLDLYSRKDDVPSPPRMTLRWPPMLTHTYRLLEHAFMSDRVTLAPGSVAESAVLSPWGGSSWFLWRARRPRARPGDLF